MITSSPVMVVGNWKMNTTIPEAKGLSCEIAKLTKDVKSVVQVLCPPFISLHSVHGVLEGSGIELGAQNVYHQTGGAFTGEISVKMLKGVVDYVIVGHSERRILFGEKDEDVAGKAIAATECDITPIVCLGERSEVREAGKAEEFILKQLRASLANFQFRGRLVIAYEPIWSIGAAKAATVRQAEEVIQAIESELEAMYGEDARCIPILYGGSVRADNVKGFLESAHIGGVLVGGASLNAADFSQIVHIADSVNRNSSI